MMQFRLRGSNGPVYSPERDIAYVFTDLVKKAFDGMAETSWEDWYGDFLRHRGLTEQDIGQIAVALAKAFAYFCDDEIQSPKQALEKAGFFDCPKEAILAVCGKIGQIMIGAFFVCLRDTLYQGEGRPLRISDLEKAAVELHQAMNDKAVAK